MRRTLLCSLILVGVTACPESVLPDFEAAKLAATEVPELPPEWKPDAALHISTPLLQDLVSVGLSGNDKLGEPFSVGAGLSKVTLTPRLTIDSLDIHSSRRCDSCITAKPVIAGHIRWKSAIGQGKIPVDATGDIDLLLESKPMGHGFVVTAKPEAVRDVSVDLGKGKTSLTNLIEKPVAERIEAELERRTEPTVIGEFGTETPLLAVRVVQSGTGLGIAMRTASPTPAALPGTRKRVITGWQLDIAEQSLLGLAQKSAFEAGAVGHGVVVVPSSLDFGAGDFDMGLRLWGTKGRGWWRDYQVAGKHEITGKRLVLKGETVTERAKSDGAALADPLVALAEGVILDTISDNVNTAMPAYQAQNRGTHSYTLDLRSANGELDGVLTLRGELLIADSFRTTDPTAMQRPK